MDKKSIPIGVKIIIFLNYLSITFGLLYVIALFCFEDLTKKIMKIPDMPGISFFTVSIIMSFFIISASIFLFFVTKGLIKARNWARIAIIVVSVFGILNFIKSFLGQQVGFFSYINLIINTFSAVYLFFSKSAIDFFVKKDIKQGSSV